MLDLEKLNQKKIILASKSPRRHFLLKELGLKFNIQTIDVEEKYPNELEREEIPLFLCKLKANAFNSNGLDDKTIVITADTIVWMGSHELNKPTDRNDAIEMLKSMSGKMHEVITGVCIKSKAITETFFVKTDVYFKELTQKEIEYYIDNYKPFDKAGAYGIQEWIGYIGVERIDGSFHNVMGLPITKLYDELHKFI